MKIVISFFIAILFSTAHAQNAELAYLSKISKSLRGTPLKMEEREELIKAVGEHRADIYISQKTQEFLKSTDFRFKFKTYIDEHFRVGASSMPNGVSYDFNLVGAYDYLVESVVQNNLSWDTLLVGKDYKFEAAKFPDFNVSDSFFYKNISGVYPKYDIVSDINKDTSKGYQKETIELHFDPQDPRIAGVITTNRFMSRYQNTALNKNRRRAAAIFRSFLCDDMVAAIPPQTSESEIKDFDTLLPSTVAPNSSGVTEDQLRRELKKSDPHGSLPGCMACHYKLDPMGQTMGLSPGGLAATASPGALVYNVPGHKVNIPVQGVGELAKTLTQQKEYLDCQVNLFWKWFIGQDVPKTQIRHDQLVTQFESSGRKPLEFISYLVQTSEFKAPPSFLTESQILARKAGKILKRCFDCHKNQNDNDEMKEWDLTDMPYGQNPRERARAIRDISDVLDLPGNGAKKEMPPKSSLWQLSSEEFATLKTWIEQGAPDYSGKRQVP